MVAALRRRLPRESILYLGDTARLPYGTKSPETVPRYTGNNIEFLLGRGVKAVVVACNTASALALPHLAPPPVPTWGVIEPGARKAAAVSRGRVGVIATEATVRSDAYPRALRASAPSWSSLAACPLFVPLVEEGWHDDPVTEQVAERYLRPLLERHRHPGARLHPLPAARPGPRPCGRPRGDAGRLRRGGRRSGGRRPCRAGLEAGERPAGEPRLRHRRGREVPPAGGSSDPHVPLEWVEVVG